MSDFYFNGCKINKVLLVGFGTTGKAIYDFLQQFSNLKIDISHNDQEFLDYNLGSYDLVALSPGIPINKHPYSQLKDYKNKLTNDIDIFYKQIEHTDVKTIAITGSNGKSTIVTLLNYVLNQLGYKSILTGNIGISPLSKLADEFDFCVIELSSFQIDLLQKANFTIGCVINISPDHLDRYKDLAEYTQSKLNLENFSKDFIIYDVDGKGLKYTGKYTLIDNSIYKGSLKLLDISQTQLFGLHNLENIIVVLNILEKLNVDISKAIGVIKTFNGLEHRCKLVDRVNQVSYINDSKGTNVGATIAALKSITVNKNIILLLGGIAKGGDFTLMKEVLQKSVKFVVIYGRDRYYINQQISNYCENQLCDNMKDAFNLAHQKSQSGDIVLLSPACASFDEFSGYAERGQVFEKLILQLKQ
ncbi:UDP-N-acetylmuramoyl-L-alanine--D-glutamate ligase [Allofrancisella guangzhouensis]|uniref:UDP-N-acetylmuramoylalanine--D-glutamate ligase n=1 Tax=Allofrancisella guangzhouensis TaxID=594679 RepID=A0A0A8E5X4_9GAMM|nr:UDP-N-acetylmuramoyl-L-alanine--D-glutamate ligase [Allofrancisella guangzhouensis]AJC49418.1 UDP-N-acetylmuramoylalanine--D-glutamate ligase [Allofrancisella guangzhouensis]MBK2026709.1 UDP-N-acetylmuramoyl-L-alanine--D-glutamate ligase [Allofrancisella guangzhouensis]MBK2043740.1 UDP-N-acetylmuramoyl-L-alanine--D-glutamate ligase [Allofrancisella guangzhouensis]MBK2046211.1 UDP-N-acetylmuramoyl-L-alanine--D-glutamate ligase [Allofrancisella guangzhouensis]